MLEPGVVISDRYEIIETLGSGGMADVYKAKCRRLDRFVAIKILKKEYSQDESFVKKFKGEAQSVAGLSHPNIVNVYDVGDDRGLYYIVMEIIEGITLKNFIERKGRLKVREAVGIAIQIGQGMEAAHKNNIIHRDIKPQNIIISKDGKVKITDFGIAKAATSHTITANAMGTVHYLSPEQARGGYSDEKSDIYSLGVTMYEMLTGQVPFEGENTVSVALLHIQGHAPSLNEVDPSIPMSLDKIVSKTMEKKPERRYLTATDLIVDLKKALVDPAGAFVNSPASSTGAAQTINFSENLSEIKNGTILSLNLDKKGQDFDDEDMDEEDIEDQERDEKTEKILLGLTIGGIVAMGVVILILILWFFGFIGNKGSKKPLDDPNSIEGLEDEDSLTFKVPSVIGMTESNATATIKLEAENVVIKYKEEYSEDIPLDQVMDQYPEAEAELIKAGEVLLTISKGPEPVRLPSVEGLKEENADKKLEEMGLVVKHEYPFSDIVEEGYVMKTVPEFGAMVVKGDEITVYVSSGSSVEKVTVPTLVGLSESIAGSRLKTADLNKGNIKKETSSSIPEGQVIRQSIQSGESVEKGTSIDLTISEGKPIQVPGSSGLTKDKYIAKLNELALKNEVVEENHASIPEGSVISTSPGAGTTVDKEATITVTISKGPEIKYVQVPANLVNKSQKDAEKALEGLGLEVSIIKKHNDTTQKELVAEVENAGEKVPVGSPIEVTISLGRAPITVPTVIDETRAKAEEELRGLGFVVSIIEDVNWGSEDDKGNVIKQNPSKGKHPVGTTVVLTIGKGENPNPGE